MTARARFGRVLAGGVVSVVAAGTVAALLLAPWPQQERQPLSITALPEPAASVLACVGPVLAVGRDAEDAGKLTDAATQDITAGTAPDALDADTGRLAADDVSDGVGPDALTAEPVDGVRTDLAAAGSASVDDSDLSGFAASDCAPALMESWLVGGSAATGAADLVVLANPSANAATVDLTVYGAEGGVQPATGTDLVVPAHTQRIVSLASLALGEASPVIRVNADDAPVQASLQTSLTRTLVPGGVDQVGTTAAPDTTQIVPSFTVAAEPGESGATETGTVVRVLAPSDDTDVTITAQPLDGGAPVTEVVTVQAGIPAEVDLAGMETGDYRLEVSAGDPVVTSVWTTTGFDAGSDFAWATAPARLGVASLVAVAAGPSPVLALSNEGEDDAVVTIDSAAGSQEVTIGAGATERVSVSAGTVLRLAPGTDTVRALVSYRGTGALASYAVIPADAAAEPVTVYPQ